MPKKELSAKYFQKLPNKSMDATMKKDDFCKKGA